MTDDVKGRRHGLITLIVLLLIFAGAVVAIVSFSKGNTAETVHRIDVAPGIWLEYAGLTTATNPEFKVKTPETFAGRLFGYLPQGLQGIVPARLRPQLPGGAVASFGSNDLNAETFNLVYLVQTSPEWRSKGGGSTFRVQQAMKDAGFVEIRYRDESGKLGSSWSFNYSSVRYGSGNDLVYANLKVGPVLTFEPRLTIEIVNIRKASKADVITSFTIQNPLYKPLDSVTAPAQELPAVSTDGEVEVRLRGAVTGALEDAWSVEYADGKASRLIMGTGKTLPETGGVPGDVFVAATSAERARSMFFLDVLEDGQPTQDWYPKEIEISYGKAKTPAPVGLFAKKAGAGYVLSGMDDVSVLPQPLWLSFELERVEHLREDEVQVLEVALPREGESDMTGTSVSLWDGVASITGISYKKVIQTMPGHTINLGSTGLIVGLEGAKRIGRQRLLGEDGRATNMEAFSRSHNKIDKHEVFSYKLDEVLSGFGEPTGYADFTTFSVEVSSPKRRVHRYEFLVNPVKATGQGKKSF